METVGPDSEHGDTRSLAQNVPARESIDRPFIGEGPTVPAAWSDHSSGRVRPSLRHGPTIHRGGSDRVFAVVRPSIDEGRTPGRALLFEAAFERWLPAMTALPAEEVIPVKLSIPDAVARALGVQPAVLD